MQHTNPQQAKAAIDIIVAVGDAIRDLTLTNENGLNGVPSGHLYAMLMGKLSLKEYQSIIDVLKRAGLVRESSHLLTWIGPKKGE